MTPAEKRFALLISSAHGMQHFFLRLLPPLIPILSAQLGLPLWKLGLLISGQYIGSAFGQAPMGILADKYDRRLFLPAGLALAGVGYAMLVLAPAADVFQVVLFGSGFTGAFLFMVLAMFVNGIGMSVVHPTGYPLISGNVRHGIKGQVLGMWGSASKFGDAVGPAVLGVLIVAMPWEGILAVIGVFGIGYAALLYVSLGRFETRPAGASQAGDGDGDDEPPLRRSVWTADRRLYIYPMLAVFTFFTIYSVVTTGVTSFIPEFISSEYGYTFAVAGFTVTPESTASFYLSALLLIAGVAQLATGRLVDRYDTRKVLVLFVLFSAALVAILASLRLEPILLFGVLAVLGVSFWGLSPARDALISEITPPEREGRTFGYLWTGTFVISSTAPVVVGYIGDTAGLRLGFLLLAAVTAVSAVPIALLFSRRVYVRARAQRDASAAD